MAVVTINYLIPNIPNKKYTWNDFTDRGPNVKVSGFYIDGDKQGFRMWTLSGIKKFYNVQGTSVYIFKDVCSAVKHLDSGPKPSGDEVPTTTIDEQYIENILDWEQIMNREYLVSVTYSNTQDKSHLVDIVQSVSGKYRVIGRIESGGCD